MVLPFLVLFLMRNFFFPTKALSPLSVPVFSSSGFSTGLGFPGSPSNFLASSSTRFCSSSFLDSSTRFCSSSSLFRSSSASLFSSSTRFLSSSTCRSFSSLIFCIRTACFFFATGQFVNKLLNYGDFNFIMIGACQAHDFFPRI